MRTHATFIRRAAVTAGVVILAATGTAAVRASTGDAPAAGVVTVTPYRILDTRNGVGAPAGAVADEQTITVQVAGVGPVPADATGVVVNLTATQGTAAGYVTAWPTGKPRPDTSVLNITPGQDVPNTVTLALGAGGRLDLFNFTGSVHLLADVVGYLAPEPERAAITARRGDTLTDTRKIIALDLTAGAWSLFAHVGGANTANAVGRLDCLLLDQDDAEVDFAKKGLAASGITQMHFADVSLQGTAVLTAAGTVSVSCASAFGTALELTTIVLTAVPVDAVVVQSGTPA